VTDQTEPSPESGPPDGPSWHPPPSTWSDPSRRYARSVDEHGLPPMPPPTRPHRKVGTRLAAGITVIGVVALGIVVGLLNTGGAKKDTPVARASSVSALTSFPAAATGGSAAVGSSVPADPTEVSSARRPATTPPATKTVRVNPSAPRATTARTASCHPDKPIIGTCYLVGETCPPADYGTSGISLNGQPMTCANRNNTWLWVAT
jgi:hypothetical protein